MKHQRSWYLWLSRRDHLPRKLKEIVRVSYDLIMSEEWSSVIINGDIPNTDVRLEAAQGLEAVDQPPMERPVEAGRQGAGLSSWLRPMESRSSCRTFAARSYGSTLEGWLTDLPRGDVSSPRTVREV